MTRRLLRILGAADVASGAVAIAAAGWLADRVDVSTTAMRVVGTVLVVLGIETWMLAARPLMAKVAIAAEMLSALVAIDVLLLADPTGIGTAILVAAALVCTAAAVDSFGTSGRQRPSPPEAPAARRTPWNLHGVRRVLFDVTVRAERFEDVYEAHATRAMRLAVALTGDRHRAEDLVADSMLRVLPKWRAGTVESMWPYLRTTIVNGFRGRLRGPLDPGPLHDVDVPSEDDFSQLVVDRSAVLAALAALPPAPRTAIALRYLEDLSEAETANVLGWPVGTVKSTVSRGLDRLRSALVDAEPETIVAGDALRERVRIGVVRQRRRRVAGTAAAVLALAVAGVLVLQSVDQPSTVDVVDDTSRASVIDLPYPHGGLAVDGVDAWTCNCFTGDPAPLLRLDVATREVTAMVDVPMHSADLVVTTPEKVWVAAGGFGESVSGGGVVWIDTATSDVAGRVDAAMLGRWSPADMVVHDDLVVVADGLEPRLIMIDADDGRIVDVLALPGVATALAAGDGIVWSNAGGDLVRSDGENVDVIEAGVPTISLSVAPDGSVWVARSDGRIEHRSVDGDVLVAVPADDLARVAAVDGGVWVADTTGIRMLDLAGEVVTGTDLADRATGGWRVRVADDGSVWRKDSSGITVWTPAAG